MDFKGICPYCFNRSQNSGICTVCGRTATANPSVALPLLYVLRKPSSEERYLIGSVLGSGGFGITYSAYDFARKKRCAVKEYFPNSLAVRSMKGDTVTPENGKEQQYNHGMLRFFEEANNLARLINVQNVVRVYDAFRQNSTVYIVMEYIEGQNLSEYASSFAVGVEYNEWARIFRTCALALSHVHQANLMHRDVSPDNILITRSGEVVLIDFGSAREYTANDNIKRSIVLKKGFAPPEQFFSNGVQGPWTDIYSLAATMYYIWTGKKIPEGTTRLDEDRYVDISVYREMSENMSKIVRKCLAVQVPMRYRNARDLVRDIDHVLFSDSAISQDKERTPSKVDVPAIRNSPRAHNDSIWKKFTSWLMNDKSGETKLDRSTNSQNNSYEQQLHFILIVSYGRKNEMRYRLNQNCRISIGKARDCNIVIDSNQAEIGMKHLILEIGKNDAIYSVYDKSETGIFLLNTGDRLRGKRRMDISMGSELSLGQSSVTIKVIVDNNEI